MGGFWCVMFYVCNFLASFLVWFPSNPCFIQFLPRMFFLPSATLFCCVHGVKIRGEGGCLHGWHRRVCIFAREIYVGAQFNVPTRSLILGPSLPPCPTGEWVIDIRGSFVSMTIHLQFRFNHLPSPARAKLVHSFLLPWDNSNLRLRPRLASLACHCQ